VGHLILVVAAVVVAVVVVLLVFVKQSHRFFVVYLSVVVLVQCQWVPWFFQAKLFDLLTVVTKEEIWMEVILVCLVEAVDLVNVNIKDCQEDERLKVMTVVMLSEEVSTKGRFEVMTTLNHAVMKLEGIGMFWMVNETKKRVAFVVVEVKTSKERVKMTEEFQLIE
jgi:hypothetical protein